MTITTTHPPADPGITMLSKPRNRIDWVERTAVCASFACLVHCLALPILLAALPALSSALPVPESFHTGMIVLAVPASSVALWSGRAHHRRLWPLLAGLVGLSLLVIGAFVFGESAAETPVTVSGSLFLVAAHLTNWRLRHRHIAR